MSKRSGKAAASGAFAPGAIAGSDRRACAGLGAGVGAAAGAAAGLAGVLLTRGPDAVLAKGSTIEMVLDRPLVFDATEVNFTTMANSGNFSDGAGPQPEEPGSGGYRGVLPF